MELNRNFIVHEENPIIIDSIAKIDYIPLGFINFSD